MEQGTGWIMEEIVTRVGGREKYLHRSKEVNWGGKGEEIFKNITYKNR